MSPCQIFLCLKACSVKISDVIHTNSGGTQTTATGSVIIKLKFSVIALNTAFDYKQIFQVRGQSYGLICEIIQ